MGLHDFGHEVEGFEALVDGGERGGFEVVGEVLGGGGVEEGEVQAEFGEVAVVLLEDGAADPGLDVGGGLGGEGGGGGEGLGGGEEGDEEDALLQGFGLCGEQELVEDHVYFELPDPAVLVHGSDEVLDEFGLLGEGEGGVVGEDLGEEQGGVGVGQASLESWGNEGLRRLRSLSSIADGG